MGGAARYAGNEEGGGRAPEAEMNASARIEIPAPGEDLTSGTLKIKGVAVGGNRGISRVEVSTDGGTSWNDAIVKPPLSQFTWVLWSYEWGKPSGPSGNTHLCLLRQRCCRGTLCPATVVGWVTCPHARPYGLAIANIPRRSPR